MPSSTVHDAGHLRIERVRSSRGTRIVVVADRAAATVLSIAIAVAGLAILVVSLVAHHL